MGSGGGARTETSRGVHGYTSAAVRWGIARKGRAIELHLDRGDDDGGIA